MVFGHLVDTVPRASAHAAAPTCSRARSSTPRPTSCSPPRPRAGRGPLPAEAAYVAASLAAVVGLVVQDCVADALTTEVVDRTGPDGAPRDPAAVQAELGDVQVLGRVAVMGGAFAVAGAGGWAAQALPVEAVFLIAAAIPLPSLARRRPAARGRGGDGERGPCAARPPHPRRRRGLRRRAARPRPRRPALRARDRPRCSRSACCSGCCG